MPVGKKDSSTAGAVSAGTVDSTARQHTPGPWEVRGPSRWIVSPAGDAELGNWLVAREVRWDGDARLIAAAPDLLEALKELVAAEKDITDYENGDIEDDREGWDEIAAYRRIEKARKSARAAITKATS